MPRYVALLRGVMPTNCAMPALRQAFEAAGFTEVKTVLGSGNVLFNANKSTEAVLERKAEAAMLAQLGRSFHTLVRPQEALQTLLAANPFEAFEHAAGVKRIVTFRRDAPEAWPVFPLEFPGDGVRFLARREREVFSTYAPHPRGPVFMGLLEKTFGKDITTRTWDTLVKCAKA